jgi:hypothetical protein
MSAIDDLGIQLANDTGYSVGNQLFKGNLPPVPDKAIAILNRIGEQPNPYIPTKSNPMFQVLVRDTSYSNGVAMLAKVRQSLEAKTPQTIGSTYFYYIIAVAEGGWIGRDENGRDMWSINFKCQIRSQS